MANYMVFQVAIHSFWQILYEIVPQKFHCLRDMAEASTSATLPTSHGSFGVSRETLPASCHNCFLNFTEWIYEYYTHEDKLVHFCQNHGLIHKQCQCPTCGRDCRLDLNKKAWRCDASCVKGKKKRKRCSFKVSIFKGTWFERSHLDIDSNLRFCWLYLSDYFSYLH